ncbi:MAG: ABC transporter ATP-binding protein [Bacteroidales bacterium]
MNSDKVLQINNLTKKYGNLRALHNLSLQVQKGSVYGLLGPNGSGKTTTLSIALGVLKPGSGNYYWFGEPPSCQSRLRIGSLIEESNFYPYLTLKDNLKIVAKIRNVPESDINKVLGLTNLLKRKYSRFANLSSGLKKRLGLAAALLGDPDVLVLDEPTKSLDPEGFSDLREIIKQQSEQEVTVILASHILDEVEKVCSHVGILKAGELIREGTVEDILGASEIYYINSDEKEKLISVLADSPMVKKYEQEKWGDIKVLLDSKYNASDLNRMTFSKKVVLSKLEVRKNTLEKEFLELIK